MRKRASTAPMSNHDSQSVPDNCDVVVIGGGPAGSSAAALLAKDGIDVVLLEKAKHPRQQVGESLIPHFWKYADLTGVSEKVERENFIIKAGGISAWEGCIRQIAFSKFGYDRPALHVERDVFDQILLQHAIECGARVFERVSARQVDFANPDQPIVHYADKRGGSLSQGRICCAYVVDASGCATVLASQFKSRTLIRCEQKFLSMWGYYRNARYFGADGKSYGPEYLAEINPVTFVMSHEDGWLWHIILREKTSVGLIIHTDRAKGLGRAALERYFINTCSSLPHLRDLLEQADYIEDSLRFRPDYSYYSTRICGENFYCIGDAAGFVDPIYSHGVQNAFYNAAVASVAIKASLKDKHRRVRYSEICEMQIRQFYGFSRSMALGDFGGDGVDRKLVGNLMKSLSPLELELMLAATEITNRSVNFRQIAEDAGVLGEFIGDHRVNRARVLEALGP